MSCICHSGNIYFDLGQNIKVHLESKVYSAFRLFPSVKDHHKENDAKYIEQLMLDLFKLNYQAYHTRYRNHIQDGECSPVVTFKELHCSNIKTLSPIQMVKDITNIMYQVCDYKDSKNQSEPLFDNMKWADDIYKRGNLLKDALYEWYVTRSEEYDNAEWKS